MDEAFELLHGHLRRGEYTYVIERMINLEKFELKSDYSDASDLNHAWYVVGDAFYKLGDQENALRSFRKALFYWSNDCDSYLAITNCSESLEEVEECIVRGLEICPNDDRLKINYANLLLDAGRNLDAKRVISKVDRDSDVHSVASDILDVVNAALRIN